MTEKPSDNETKKSCGSPSACVSTNVDELSALSKNFADIFFSETGLRLNIMPQ